MGNGTLKELDWLREPYLRRTEDEQAQVNRLVDEFMATHNCRYDLMGMEEEEVTAQPKPIDKHKFTPTERITLDYRGRF